MSSRQIFAPKMEDRAKFAVQYAKRYNLLSAEGKKNEKLFRANSLQNACAHVVERRARRFSSMIRISKFVAFSRLMNFCAVVSARDVRGVNTYRKRLVFRVHAAG